MAENKEPNRDDAIDESPLDSLDNSAESADVERDSVDQDAPAPSSDIDNAPHDDDASDSGQDGSEDDASESDDAGQSEEDEVYQPKRRRTVAPVKKSKATPKQKDVNAKKHEKKRTTPAMFVRQSVAELKQVKWPNASTVQQYFWVVLVFVLFIMFLVAGLDWLFGLLMLKTLG